jgi:O-Antigen ligase
MKKVAIDEAQAAGAPLTLRTGALLRLLPVTALAAFAWVLAWDARGSIAPADWLPYASASALVLGAVLLSGAAVRADRVALLAASLLLAFAAWSAISIDWSPLRASGRDEALLALFYVVAFAIPLLTLRSETDRIAASVIVALALAGLALATLLELRISSSPDELYTDGRLDFPISYWNGEAAVALVGFWPAIALAADRRLPPLVRGLMVGGSAAMLMCWIATQSKGGAVALAASGIVFFAVSSARLRALVPAVVAAGLAAAAVNALTDPYRAGGAELADVVRRAGLIALILTGAGLALGLVYALLDRRVRVSATAQRLTGAVVLALLAAALLAGIAAFFVQVDRPGRFFERRWEEFTSYSSSGGAEATHFTALGSNRYDFWRVALDEFVRHPLAGAGARGWPAAYLLEGRSDETPLRSHSVELDALSETGIVGFLLLVGGGVLAFVVVGRRARRSLLATGLLGAGVYFAVHTGGDWVWTFPAIGVPVFLLLGIGSSPDGGRPLPAVAAVPAGLVALAAALFAFAPPWLSAKFTDRAYEAGSPAQAADDLRWARRLDPLAIDPLLAEAALATPPSNLPPLERAVRAQPRDAEARFLLGLAYLDLGRKAAARRELGVAAALSPRDEAVRAALRRSR